MLTRAGSTDTTAPCGPGPAGRSGVPIRPTTDGQIARVRGRKAGQRIVLGVGPHDLRDNEGLRQHVATELSRVQSVLDGLLVDRPRRNILRRPK